MNGQLIDIWYGTGMDQPLGPLMGKLIEYGDPYSLILITDSKWLEELDLEPFTCKCRKLGPDNRVSYDDYRWSFMHESPEINNW